MNICKESGGSLRVELSADELHTFQLSYSQLNYQNEKTKRLLKTVLEGAGRMVGFCQKPHRLLIEVFPAPDRGCTLYFTPLEPSPKRYRRTQPCLYRFACCDHLLAALQQIPADHQKEGLRLGEHYFLILQRNTPCLLEFGDRLPATRSALAYLREHGQPLTFR